MTLISILSATLLSDMNILPEQYLTALESRFETTFSMASGTVLTQIGPSGMSSVNCRFLSFIAAGKYPHTLRTILQMSALEKFSCISCPLSFFSSRNWLDSSMSLSVFAFTVIRSSWTSWGNWFSARILSIGSLIRVRGVRSSWVMYVKNDRRESKISFCLEFSISACISFCLAFHLVIRR